MKIGDLIEKAVREQLLQTAREDKTSPKLPIAKKPEGHKEKQAARRKTKKRVTKERGSQEEFTTSSLSSRSHMQDMPGREDAEDVALCQDR